MLFINWSWNQTVLINKDNSSCSSPQRVRTVFEITPDRQYTDYKANGLSTTTHDGVWMLIVVNKGGHPGDTST